MKWIIHHVDSERSRLLAQEARLSELVAALLVARGIETPDAAKAFLSANLKDHLRKPFQLPGCIEVATRLHEAIRANKKIIVYGDYDVDGITGTVILLQTIRDLGGTAGYYVPSRHDEGYGLNCDALRKLAQEDEADLVVTVDCGISSIEEALLAQELGLELLITDHHHPGRELPAATAIAHPQLVRLDEELVSPTSLNDEQISRAEKYPFGSLCGATVALKVAWGLCQLVSDDPDKKVSDKLRDRLLEMTGLAAMGTVADFVPLLDENRALVRSGIKFLQPKTASRGMRKLLDTAGYVEGKTDLNSEFIAFQLAPRLNAAGRLCQARLAVELLISDDDERTTELAQYIDNLNESRKTLERKIQKEAIHQIEEQFDPQHDPAFVLAHPDWHKGVIGIVAGRLAERYHRPVILFGKDAMGINPAVGSARSIPGFDLYAALDECHEYLIRFGGHQSAAGLSILNERIAEFREAFCDVAKTKLTEEQYTAELFIDGYFHLGAFTKNTVAQIKLLAPFGAENKKPVFAAEQVIASKIKPLGKDGSHFAAEFSHGTTTLRGIAWSRKEWVTQMQSVQGPIDIAFKVQLSHYSGAVELELLDWKKSE